ncbi:MAG: urate hydroxylase PuuD [Kofleriaceae bacterium]
MHVTELLDVIFRWAHLIAGIMWVGNSMLFNWLDRNLEKSKELGRLSQGKIWMLHSGAFYETEKKLLAPGEMPATLHWFKWQNFTTWATGISLFVIVYYLNNTAYLVDPSLHDISRGVALTASISTVFVAWLLYDLLWRLLGEKRPMVATVLTIMMLLGAIFAFGQVFSGRGAYMQIGVIIGTIMTGNVWMVIVPSQRELVNATNEGREQDATLSIRAKQRSIHNNYLTFPLLFIMVSNHVPAATAHPLNWLILILVMIGGAGVRHFMNVRYLGAGKELAKSAWLGPAIGAGAFTIAAFLVVTRIQPPGVADAAMPVSFKRAHEIIALRCATCHSAKPSDDMFTTAPNGVVLDTPPQIKIMAERIRVRSVEQKGMPFNNKTGMTDKERGELGRWIRDGALLE